jgi:hypothetical protein
MGAPSARQLRAGERAAWGLHPGNPSPPAIVATNLRPIDKGSLKATVDLVVSRWHLAFRGCLWFSKDGKEWIAFPSKEWTNSDGDKKYSVLIEFTDRKTAERFQTAALAAMRALAGAPR